MMIMERDPNKWNPYAPANPEPDWDFWRPVIRDHKETCGWHESWKDETFRGWTRTQSRLYGSSRRLMDVKVPWREVRDFAIRYWESLK